MIKLDKSKIVKSLGKKNKLVPYLDKAIAEFDEPWTFDYEPKKGDQGWHPSGHCTPSAGELYVEAYELLHSEPVAKGPNPINRHFQVGHFWHQYLQHIILNKLEFCKSEAIEKRGGYFWGNSSVKNPSPFEYATGSGDVAPLELPNWTGILDIKTMKYADFRLAGLPPAFGDKYECQINIYMSFFDQEEALILAINKDSPHNFKEFTYKKNQDLIDTIYAKWEFVSECLLNETVPTEKDDERFVLPLTGPLA